MLAEAIMDEKDFDELTSDYGDAEYEGENPNQFVIRDPLPPPSASLYTTKELHDLIHEGEIDLSPPYQRAVVWNREKQMTLIDSIFRNFYIPPVLFMSRKPSKEFAPKICMDGKQRLSSIQAFIDGQIPYRDPNTRRLFYYSVSNSQAKKKLVIPDKYKAIFNSKQITCVEFKDIDPAIERDVFQRVQLGVALTAAEKLAAISSPYADWISELDYRHIRGIDDGLGEKLRWDSNRGKHFQGIAQIAFCIENLPDRSEPTSVKLNAWLNRVDPPSQKFKEEIEDVLKRYWEIATNEKLRHGLTDKKTKVSPVEFAFIGVLIYILRYCDDETIADEISNMRKEVRAQHVDIRANAKLFNSLWNFIDKVKTKHSNKSNGGTKKRRRGDMDIDDDDDYRATPIKSLGIGLKTRAKK